MYSWPLEKVHVDLHAIVQLWQPMQRLRLNTKANCCCGYAAGYGKSISRPSCQLKTLLMIRQKLNGWKGPLVQFRNRNPHWIGDCSIKYNFLRNARLHRDGCAHWCGCGPRHSLSPPCKRLCDDVPHKFLAFSLNYHVHAEVMRVAEQREDLFVIISKSHELLDEAF